MVNVKKVLVALIVLGLVPAAHADLFFDDFEGYNLPIPNNPPPDLADRGLLEGQGGWVAADAPGDASAMYVIDTFGGPNSGVYPSPTNGDDGPYFAGGTESAFNGIAHSIGALSEGNQVSWIMNIAHASGFMDVAIGSNLANGNAADDQKIHLEMGGAAGNLTYYRVFDVSGNSVQEPPPVHTTIDAGAMGLWTEVEMTMGAGLTSIDLRARNLSRFDDGQGGTPVGIAPWVDFGTFPVGTLNSTSDLWISFTGQSGAAENWSQIVGFDNVNVTTDVASSGIFIWQANGLGDWSNTNSWLPTNGPPNDAAHTAVFGSSASISKPTVAVLSQPVTVNRIEFDNATHSYLIAGLPDVTLAPTVDSTFPTIEVVQGTHEFQAPVQLLGDTTVNVGSGSTLTFNNQLDLNGQTLTKIGPGTIAINNDLLSGNGGTFVCFDGTCSGNGSISGNVNNSGGTISPGNSPGVMQVGGDFNQQAGASLLIEIAGMDAGTDHDVLDVEGQIGLGGDLDVVLLDGFDPAVGDSFDILDFGSLAGEFDNVSLPALATGLAWDDSALYADGTLSVVPEPVGLVLALVALIGLTFRRGY